jgi:hypothetical protein
MNLSQDYNDVDELNNKERNEYMHMLYSSFTLSEFLKNNDNNIEDPDFISLYKELNPSIDVLEMIDYELCKDQFAKMLEEYDDMERYAVLYKNAFIDAKIGDIINGGIVIGIFLFTIWIYKDPETGHKYCCESCDCK